MDTPVIRVENLVKRFKGHLSIRTHTAVDGLSFQVDRGGVCGFLGPNGAGKTTTLKILMDLIRADAGSAEIFGRAPGDAAVKARLGYLPETPYFYDHLTGRELLRYYGQLRGLGDALIAARSADLLKEVGMTHAADRRLRTYSKGMLQRIGMAQALIGDPELVVLDEPMTGLDPIGRAEFRGIIMNLRARGKTVIFSSHILADAEALCDRVVIINKSKMVSAGSLQELLSGHADRVRVSLAGLSAGGWSAGFTPVSSPEGVFNFLVPDPETGNQLVARALAAGGRLVAFESLHPDLETIFVKRVQEDAQ